MTQASSAMLRLILRQPRLSKGEELELFRRLKGGDSAAATRLVTSHLRFVLHIARRYRNHGHPLADLIQEGTVGLMEALKRFNPERGVRLSTYSMWWIRAAIQDYVIRSRSLVKMGTTAAQKALFLSLRRAMAERPDSDGVNEDIARRLATRFNTSVADVLAFARRITRPDQSIDAPLAGDDGISLGDHLADPSPSPEQSVVEASEGRAWQEWLSKALSALPPRELLIIRRRFLTERAPSRAALGRELGLSKERVRQLELRALERLKTFLQPFRDGADPATARLTLG